VRIALVDAIQGGHHELHLKTAARALAEAGHEVWLLYPEPEVLKAEIIAGKPELSDLIRGAALQRLAESKIGHRLRLTYTAKWKAVAKALREVESDGKRFDLAFFMYLDAYLCSLLPITWLDRAFKYKWAGIYMQPLFRMRGTSMARRPGFLTRDHLLHSHHFNGAMALDESSLPWLKDRFGKPFVAMAEYGNIAIPDLEAAIVKELVAFAAGRPIVGLFGALAKRKGVLTLLRAAKFLENTDCVFAIAGKLASQSFSPEELEELNNLTATLSSKCFYRPQNIETDAAFSALMSISSVCYIAYEDWVFSSGLQSIAAEFDVPAVVADSGVMGERVNHFGTGITIDPTSPEEAAEAIKTLLSKKLPPDGFATYRAQHRIEAFEKDLCALVAAAGAG
jgi:glycosyltransferase involved in cell wall biosynthesis